MVGHRPLKASILVRIQAPQHSRIIGVDFAKILCNSFVFTGEGKWGQAPFFCLLCGLIVDILHHTIPETMVAGPINTMFLSSCMLISCLCQKIASFSALRM